MHSIKKISIGILASIALAACSSIGGNSNAQTKVTDGILTDSKGMTLYTFDKDSNGRSACNGPCATNWPPLLVESGSHPTGDFSAITRDDGKKQLAYKGKPLYLWAKDTKPGDKTGDGFLNNSWHIIKP